MQYWDWVSVAGADCHFWQIGPLKIWIRRTLDEWLVATAYDVRAAEDLLIIGKAVPRPDQLSWTRLIVADERQQVRLLPVTPNRPLVIRPETPLTIPAVQSCLFYAGLALWVRVEIGPEEPLTLCEVPTIVLSNTWFGEVTEGELCYSLRTSARRELAKLPARPHRARCAVTVQNQSDINLELKRFCLRSAYCRIYHGLELLWASPVKLVYNGGTGNDTLADCEFGEEPDGAGPVTLITPARERHAEGFFARLQNLRSFAS